MSLHERPGASSEWYTPPHVFEAMGADFDLDVASPGCEVTPWIPAHEFIRKGVVVPWEGFVWMNPPFGGRNGIIPWMEKFFSHGNGIALTPDRTSAPWWQTYAPKADALLFVSPKIHFIPGPGVKRSSPAQGTTLMALGPRGVRALSRAASHGLGVFGAAA